MKKIIIILLLTITALSKETKAQGYGVPDTLVYLHDIVANKANYIGQPFAILLNDLQIQIKYFSRFPGIPHDKTKETSTEFCFYFPRSPDEIYLTYPSLEIYWQPYLDAEESGLLFRSTGGSWSSNAETFYSTGIITDIKVRE